MTQIREDFQHMAQLLARAKHEPYDAVNGPDTVRVVEHLEVVNGRLVRSTVVVDTAAFRAFFGM